MSDPYLKIGQRPPAEKKLVLGHVVATLGNTLRDRNLVLIPSYSRAMVRGAIHEVVATDEVSRGPSCTVDRVAYLCFVEVTQGGVAMVGDRVTINGLDLGPIVGFNEDHAPNHINIVLEAKRLACGLDISIELDGIVMIGDASRQAEGAALAEGAPTRALLPRRGGNAQSGGAP